MSTFWTLLGPDFAGKSTALARLRDAYGWQVVSHDDRFVTERPLIAALRHWWLDEALVWAGKRYSTELVASVLHSVILYQRDELARCQGPQPVIVDSYFYKVLAACRLLGIAHRPTFDRWRKFPSPARVVYLDVPPEVAWQRTGQGAAVSRFEHYGESVSWESFARLQRDLRTEMLAEVAHLPVTIVDGTAAPEAVQAAIRAAVTGDRSGPPAAQPDPTTDSAAARN